jgi:hypothetical protein
MKNGVCFLGLAPPPPYNNNGWSRYCERSEAIVASRRLAIGVCYTSCEAACRCAVGQRHNRTAGRWCQPMQGGFLRKLHPACRAGSHGLLRRHNNGRSLPSNRVAIAPQTPMASAKRLPRNDGRQPAACKTRKPPINLYTNFIFLQKFFKNSSKMLSAVYIYV